MRRSPSSRQSWSAAAALTAGCASVPAPEAARGQEPAPDVQPPTGDWKPAKKEANGDEKDTNKDEKEGKKDEKKGPPKTLFQWAVGPEVEDPDDDEPKPIITDRPDFTEASSTVGLAGSSSRPGTRTRGTGPGGRRGWITRTPKPCSRIGLFADWFELRLGENYHSTRATFAHPIEHHAGLEDLYVGAKVALLEQKAYLPEVAVILQALVPTGSGGESTGRLLPGANFCYGWDVVKDVLDAGGVFLVNGAVDSDRHSYVELAQSFSLGYRVTKTSGPTPSGTPSTRPAQPPADTSQHYFDTGLAYQLTPDFQLDVRAGWGLSKSADDFFAGAGFSVRY